MLNSQQVLYVAVLFFFASCCFICTEANISEDIYITEWGNKEIDWYGNLSIATEKATEQKKPIMLLIHRLWCGMCRTLLPKFNDNKEIPQLSKDFVMLSLYEDNQPEDEEYRPDGEYYPRLLFLYPNGKVMKKMRNQPDGLYAYFHPVDSSIVRVMKEVTEMFKADKWEEQYEEEKKRDEEERKRKEEEERKKKEEEEKKARKQEL